MKPLIEWRPKPRWRASGESDATPAPGKSGIRPSKKLGRIVGEPSTASRTAAASATAGTSADNPLEDALHILTHKRSVKAAQMRRWRARKKGKT